MQGVRTEALQADTPWLSCALNDLKTYRNFQRQLQSITCAHHTALLHHISQVSTEEAAVSSSAAVFDDTSSLSPEKIAAAATAACSRWTTA